MFAVVLENHGKTTMVRDPEDDREFLHKSAATAKSGKKKTKESEDREGQREEVEEKGVCLNVNLPAGRRSDKTLDNRGTRVNSRDVRCYWPTDIIGRC